MESLRNILKRNKCYRIRAVFLFLLINIFLIAQYEWSGYYLYTNNISESSQQAARIIRGGGQFSPVDIPDIDELPSVNPRDYFPIIKTFAEQVLTPDGILADLTADVTLDWESGMELSLNLSNPSEGINANGRAYADGNKVVYEINQSEDSQVKIVYDIEGRTFEFYLDAPSPVEGVSVSAEYKDYELGSYLTLKASNGSYVDIMESENEAEVDIGGIAKLNYSFEEIGDGVWGISVREAGEEIGYLEYEGKPDMRDIIMGFEPERILYAEIDGVEVEVPEFLDSIMSAPVGSLGAAGAEESDLSSEEAWQRILDRFEGNETLAKVLGGALTAGVLLGKLPLSASDNISLTTFVLGPIGAVLYPALTRVSKLFLKSMEAAIMPGLYEEIDVDHMSNELGRKVIKHGFSDEGFSEGLKVIYPTRSGGGGGLRSIARCIKYNISDNPEENKNLLFVITSEAEPGTEKYARLMSEFEKLQKEFEPKGVKIFLFNRDLENNPPGFKWAAQEDVIALINRGDWYPQTFTNPDLYGTYARSRNKPVFNEIWGPSMTKIDSLAELQEFIPEGKFKHSLLLDKNDFVGPGDIRVMAAKIITALNDPQYWINGRPAGIFVGELHVANVQESPLSHGMAQWEERYHWYKAATAWQRYWVQAEGKMWVVDQDYIDENMPTLEEQALRPEVINAYHIFRQQVSRGESISPDGLIAQLQNVRSVWESLGKKYQLERLDGLIEALNSATTQGEYKALYPEIKFIIKKLAEQVKPWFKSHDYKQSQDLPTLFLPGVNIYDQRPATYPKFKGQLSRFASGDEGINLEESWNRTRLAQYILGQFGERWAEEPTLPTEPMARENLMEITWLWANNWAFATYLSLAGIDSMTASIGNTRNPALQVATLATIVGGMLVGGPLWIGPMAHEARTRSISNEAISITQQFLHGPNRVEASGELAELFGRHTYASFRDLIKAWAFIMPLMPDQMAMNIYNFLELKRENQIFSEIQRRLQDLMGADEALRQNLIDNPEITIEKSGVLEEIANDPKWAKIIAKQIKAKIDRAPRICKDLTTAEAVREAAPEAQRAAVVYAAETQWRGATLPKWLKWTTTGLGAAMGTGLTFAAGPWSAIGAPVFVPWAFKWATELINDKLQKKFSPWVQAIIDVEEESIGDPTSRHFDVGQAFALAHQTPDTTRPENFDYTRRIRDLLVTGLLGRGIRTIDEASIDIIWNNELTGLEKEKLLAEFDTENAAKQALYEYFKAVIEKYNLLKSEGG